MNDNDPTMLKATVPSSDAHGQAALVLVESLIHVLCESSTLSNEQAVDVAETAVEVQHDKAEAETEDGGEAPVFNSPAWQAHTLLSSIATSLRIDGQGKPAGPRLV